MLSISASTTRIGDLGRSEPSQIPLKRTDMTDLKSDPADLYLELMERCLTNSIYEDGFTDWREPGTAKPFHDEMRRLGRDWPQRAHTMIGRERLGSLRRAVDRVIAEDVPGDLIETGAWRGGASIMMRAVLKARGVADRRVFVADSFEGLPPPNVTEYPADEGDKHHEFPELAVSVEEVRANFAKYDLLDDQVCFLKGWFKDTLAVAPIERLAVLRLDGDMYESTMDSLTALYDKVSRGGFVIIDDYGCIEACRRAVTDFRLRNGISEPIVDIDGWGVYWRKDSEAGSSKPVAQAYHTPDVAGDRPFWSVIVPVYEQRGYLKQCLDSILDQDPGPEHMEIMLVDDCGPKDFNEIVQTLGRGRVQLHRNPVNLGLYPSLNQAIGRTRGHFIHILHDDDWVTPGFYGAMRRGLEAAPSSVGVGFGNYEVHREAGGETWRPEAFRDGPGLMPRDFLTRLATMCPLNVAAVVYRREAFPLVGPFRTDMPQTADWEWYVRSGLHVEWFHEPGAVACFRAHNNSQTRRLARSFVSMENIRKTYEIFEATLPQDIAGAAVPAGRAAHTVNMLNDALSQLDKGNVDIAWRVIREALALYVDAPVLPRFHEVLRHQAAVKIRNAVRDGVLSM